MKRISHDQKEGTIKVGRPREEPSIVALKEY